MHIELLLLGSLFGALALVVKLTGQRQRSWVERDLYVGDLRTLNDIAFPPVRAGCSAVQTRIFGEDRPGAG